MLAGCLPSRPGRICLPRRGSWVSPSGSGRSPPACWCCSSLSRCACIGTGPDALASRHRRTADWIVAVSYVVPMAAAAMASVLLSLVLLALAVAEKLPIPRIDLAVRWVAVRRSAVLGDSYMLAHCPVLIGDAHSDVLRPRRLQDRARQNVRVCSALPRPALSPQLQVLEHAPIGRQACRRSSPSGRGSRNFTCCSAWTGIRRRTGRHGGPGYSSLAGWPSRGSLSLPCSRVTGRVPCS